MSENPHDFTLKIVSIETKFNQTSQKNFRPLGICLINKKSTPMSTADIKKHWHRKLSRSKNWFWGGSSSGAIPPNHAKIFVS